MSCLKAVLVWVVYPAESLYSRLFTNTVFTLASGLRLCEFAKTFRYQAIWLPTDSVCAPNCWPVGSAIRLS